MPQNKEQTPSVKPAEVMKLADIVSYQEGAVVSRELVSKNTGTVTVFAFDAGQGLSEHTAPFDALVYLIDGEAEVTIAGKPLRLASGDMVVMPANKPHALKAVTRFKMVLTMIRA
jgi:quercetin dioxygenase-like cupin family protein